jgi:hypothetical protein
MAEQTTIGEFSAASGIGRSVTKSVIEFLAAKGIGTSAGATLHFSGKDRLEAATPSRSRRAFLGRTLKA